MAGLFSRISKILLDPLRKLDNYPITFAFEFDSKAGYKSAFGGLVFLVMVILCIIVIVTEFVTEAVSENYSASTTDERGESEMITFASIDQEVPLGFLFINKQSCMYISVKKATVDRDCILSFASEHIFVESIAYSNSLDNSNQRNPIPLGNMIGECNDEFFDEIYEEYIGSDYSLEFFKNMTFCFQASDFSLETSLTYQLMSEFRYIPSEEAEYQAEYDEAQELYSNLDQLMEDALVELSSSRSEMTSEEYSDALSGISTFYDKINAFLNTKTTDFNVRLVVRQKVVNTTAEAQTGEPFSSEIFGFHIIGSYDFDQKQVELNYGIFSHWQIEFKNEEVCSNRGSSLFWRTQRCWENVKYNSNIKGRTMQTSETYGILLFTVEVASFHSSVIIYYNGIIDVLGNTGGTLTWIGYLSFLIIFTKRVFIKRAMANEYFLRKEDEQIQPYSGSVGESLLLILREIAPCFFKKPIREVEFKGKKVEAFEIVSNLVSNSISLEQDIISKRKVEFLEQAITTEEERALLRKLCRKAMSIEGNCIEPLESSFVKIEGRIKRKREEMESPSLLEAKSLKANQAN